jgi:hypothetical protein
MQTNALQTSSGISILSSTRVPHSFKRARSSSKLSLPSTKRFLQSRPLRTEFQRGCSGGVAGVPAARQGAGADRRRRHWASLSVHRGHRRPPWRLPRLPTALSGFFVGPMRWQRGQEPAPSGGEAHGPAYSRCRHSGSGETRRAARGGRGRADQGVELLERCRLQHGQRSRPGALRGIVALNGMTLAAQPGDQCFSPECEGAAADALDVGRPLEQRRHARATSRPTPTATLMYVRRAYDPAVAPERFDQGPVHR